MKMKPEEKKLPKEGKTKNLVGTRGKTFKGIVTKKFPTRIVIEFICAV